MNENIRDFQEQAAPDPWDGQIFTIADAFKPREPVQYRVGGLFQEGSVSIVYGPPGSLKSMLMGDVLMSVSTGRAWLGRTVTHGPTLWMDLDNGKRRTHDRVEALARAHNAPEDTPFYYVSMPSPWFNAGKKDDIEALIRRIRLLGITFIVIDNLSLICPGADENSDQMVEIMSNLRNIAEKTGTAIVIIHHQRKTIANARAGESLRGHSSIESAVDLALRVTREPDSNVITIQSTKTRDMDVPMFACQFLYEHKPGTIDLEMATFEPVEIEDKTSDRAIEKCIIEIIMDNPGINQTQIIIRAQEFLECGEKQIRNIICRLERKKRIKVRQGERRAKLYYYE